ncbi:protein fem-1 homolog C-like [Macrobrachium nipponense]|uniref:protein fem-1 homolog C-like n=1 Tax=Macrobrachium nipponense TaxID=159736 RepID=UPI0030C885F2
MLACNRGSPEVARYLVEIGANVNRQRIDGRTALHECADYGHLESVELLLDHYAYITPDSMGETPLLCASLSGHAHVVEYMISRRELISQEDRIEALELLGATFADKRRDVAIAVMYWEMAMDERRDNDIPVNPEADDPLYTEYFQEVTTPQQLEEIRYSRDAIAIQSMLVRARVLGYTHEATFNDMRRKGEKFASTGDVKQCIVLWMRGLEMQQKALAVLDHRRLFFLTSLTDMFADMVLRYPELGDNNAMYFEDVLRLFENCCREVAISVTDKTPLASHMVYFHYLDRFIPLAMHVLLVLLKINPQLSSAQLLTVKKLVYRLVKLDPRDSTGRTLLHTACGGGFIIRDGSPLVSTFPSLEVVNVLLETGADPCAMDQYRNTPLHMLGLNGECPRGVVDALLSAGGHLDAVNEDGLTFGTLRVFHGEKLHQIVDPVRHTSLQCLAAAVVRKHGIEYKNVVHPRLERFVDMH